MGKRQWSHENHHCPLTLQTTALHCHVSKQRVPGEGRADLGLGEQHGGQCIKEKLASLGTSTAF